MPDIQGRIGNVMITLQDNTPLPGEGKRIRMTSEVVDALLDELACALAQGATGQPASQSH